LRSRWSNANLEKKQYSCSTFMMYLGVEGDYPHEKHHTIHISRDYKKNLQEIEIDKVLPTEPSIYIQNPGVTDPSMAPEGKSPLYVLVPVPHVTPKTPWDARQKAFYREVTLDKMEEVGFHDIRKRIVYESICTPADWKSDFFVYRGATFNLAHNLGQMLHLRPHNKFEELDGVYLVGGGTHPGSGLPVIYESSRITCKQLLPELGLPSQFIHDMEPMKHESELVAT
jgi:phytoene desaturase